MLPFKVKESDVSQILNYLKLKIHSAGALEAADLETLAHVKRNYPQCFEEYENTFLYILGLFYKVNEPSDLISQIYSSFKEEIKNKFGDAYTPVQASILSSMSVHDNFSFSAPTSVGKSYLFRTLILKNKNDIVFVVPSRSLIHEYLIQLKRVFKDDQGIQIQQFIDKINLKRTKQRIFVVTPERAMDLFKFKDYLNVSLIVFDEAQISEEKQRGITFDAFVRKVDKQMPDVKKVFAHPFIENPEAQLNKHGLPGKGISYKHQVVGKIYLSYSSKNKSFSYFSPFVENCNSAANKLKFTGDFVSDAIVNDKKILIYVTKSKIVDSSFLKEFEEYIDICSDVKNKEAIDIIKKIDDFIKDTENKSVMLKMLKKGIVIHHGSIPLAIRSLLEEFTLKGFAKICFSTSTLLQGVNMPFDIVWVYSQKFLGDEEDRVLGLKNLIGRAGRSSRDKREFDIGYVIVNNPRKFSSDLMKKSTLKNSSVLEELDDSKDSHISEFVDSIKNNEFNDDYKLPEARVVRLESNEVMSSVEYILKNLFNGTSIVSGDEYKNLKKSKKDQIKKAFKNVFEISLGRKLEKAESGVLSKGIAILLWQIQGKSFKEILRLRYLYLVDQDIVKELKRSFKFNEIDSSEFKEKLNKSSFGFSPIASQLPNINLKNVNVFAGQTYESFNYDLLVYDTYDFLDKVISFSLADVYSTVFSIYFHRYKDSRAMAMKNFFKYGTDDQVDIMLLRYGFVFEEINWIRDHVEHINEEEIIFYPSIYDCEKEQFDLIKSYL